MIVCTVKPYTRSVAYQQEFAQLVNYRFVLPAQITVLQNIITEVMHIKSHLLKKKDKAPKQSVVSCNVSTPSLPLGRLTGTCKPKRKGKRKKKNW